MIIEKTKLEGVLIIKPRVLEDARGWFVETYNKKDFFEAGIDIDFVQDNHSHTLKKGSLRGLHLQKNPYAQSKLVSCVRGTILDVAVDLRKESKTYKSWVAVELSEENKKKLFIPKGFAHGFLTLKDNTEVVYKVDEYWHKESEETILFDDPDIGIDWGEDKPILSEKDRAGLFLKDCNIDF